MFRGILQTQCLETAAGNTGNNQGPKISRKTKMQKALASFYVGEILSDFFAFMIWNSANVQFMRSSQLYKIIVKSLCFFISIYGWGILSFSEKLWTTQQIRHNEESLTLMTTLSTQEARSGGQLKVETHFFPSSFSVKGSER